MKLPEDIIIPASRRDLTSQANISWLLRNLGVCNKDHPQFDIIIKQLKEKER